MDEMVEFGENLICGEFPIRFGCTGEVKRFLHGECGKYYRLNRFGIDLYRFNGATVAIKGGFLKRTIYYNGSKNNQILKGLEKKSQREAIAA